MVHIGSCPPGGSYLQKKPDLSELSAEGFVPVETVFFDAIADLALSESEFSGGSDLHPAVSSECSLDFGALKCFK